MKAKKQILWKGEWSEAGVGLFYLKTWNIRWAEQLVPQNVTLVRFADEWKRDSSKAEGSFAVISYKQMGERVNEASQMSQQTVTAV